MLKIRQEFMIRKSMSVLASLILSTSIFAQTNNNTKGYRGEISLGDTFGLNAEYGSVLSFQTTHGVAFTDGAFVGAGIGVFTDMDYLMIPIFLKVSQSFCRNNTIKPFVSFSLGCYLNSPEGVALYTSPEFGIEISRFRLFSKYNSYQNTDHYYWQGDVGETIRSMTIGVAFRFGK